MLVLLYKKLMTNITFLTFGLLTEREVEMAGYWPRPFFVRPFLSHLDQAGLVNNGFIIEDKEK